MKLQFIEIKNLLKLTFNPFLSIVKTKLQRPMTFAKYYKPNRSSLMKHFYTDCRKFIIYFFSVVKFHGYKLQNVILVH